MQDESIRARDLARRELYAFISMATADPATREKRLEDATAHSIVNAALELIRDDVEFHPASLGPGEIDPAGLTVRLPSQVGLAIEREYAAVFGYCTSRNCPPYEMEFCPQKDIHYRNQQLADVAGFYTAFGLKASPKVHDRLDHISLEAEFMSVLITRELYALENGFSAEAAKVCHDAQRTFFKDHLAGWLPAFGQTLMNQASDFYVALGKIICAFVPAERAILGVPPVDQIPKAKTYPQEEMTCG